MIKVHSSLFPFLMMAKCFTNANKKVPEDSCSFLLYRWWWSRNRWRDLPETTCKKQPLSWELTMELLPHVWWAGEGYSGINREQDIPRGRKILQNILASNEAAHLRVLHFRWDRWRTQNLRYSKLIWGISNQFPLKLMETLMQSTLRSSSRFFPSKIFPLTWKQVVPKSSYIAGNVWDRQSQVTNPLGSRFTNARPIERGESAML